MVHYCRVCCRKRPNERFSASGLKARVCKECQKLPRERREYLEAVDELNGLVAQANLSARNVARLKVLSKSSDETIRTRAQVLLEVAGVHPHKSKRVTYLREKRPELCDAYLAAFPPEPPTLKEPASDGDAGDGLP